MASSCVKIVRYYHHECSGIDPKVSSPVGRRGANGGLGIYGWGDLEFVGQFT